MLQQMVIKMSKADKEFWSLFAQKLHCKDTTEFARKLTVIMRTTPTSEFREWFYSRLAKAEEEQDTPITRILRTVLEYAIRDNASEIHLLLRTVEEPIQWQAEGNVFQVSSQGDISLHILYRIDGNLQEQMRVPGYVHAPLLTYIKSKSGLWDEHTSQQGTLRFDLGEKSYSWPVAITPTELGEKVVIGVQL